MTPALAAVEWTPIDFYLAEQQQLTPVERFASRHANDLAFTQARYHRELIPADRPGPGQQYAFAIDLDACTGCKACVVACRSMNGLDHDESWRSVGLLHGGSDDNRFQQTVTSGCHHCVDPACLAGCPVDAYEKDPETGIVAHLDDQCIGCGYCTLTCPYEVPRYSSRRGIVRKCDLCQDRLAVGEAPACVQACPNGAISVELADTAALVAAADGTTLVPGAPSSGITIPSTTYRTTRPAVADGLAADRFSVEPAHAHNPLTVMLVLTQLSVGAFLADLVLRAPSRTNSLVALAAGLLALGASVLHLGRPRLAWRVVIGVGHSWLSREAVAFGAFAALAVPYAGLVWMAPDAGLVAVAGWTVAASGMAGVACSVLIYATTQRAWWRASATTMRFGMTTLLCGAATALWSTAARGGDADSLILVVLAIGPSKLAWEASVLRHRRALPAGAHRAGREELHRTATLLRGDLARAWAWRVFLGVVGAVVLPIIALGATGWGLLAVASLLLGTVVAAELVERWLFFTAASPPRMPGQLR